MNFILSTGKGELINFINRIINLSTIISTAVDYFVDNLIDSLQDFAREKIFFALLM